VGRRYAHFSPAGFRSDKFSSLQTAEACLPVGRLPEQGELNLRPS